MEVVLSLFAVVYVSRKKTNKQSEILSKTKTVHMQSRVQRKEGTHESCSDSIFFFSEICVHVRPLTTLQSLTECSMPQY